MLEIDAGNLNRFMQCNGYRLLPPDNVSSFADNTVREEGNAAHWLASVAFAGQHTVSEMVDRKAPNGIFITAEMAEHVSEYLDVIDRSNSNMEWGYSLAPTSLFAVNGRADNIGGYANTLVVRDFKYGFTIVEPEMNWTLISHALGYCYNFGWTPDAIEFVIHQPRAAHRDGKVRSWKITGDVLNMLANQLFNTLANPSNTLQTGKHCYKCPAFNGCPARQDVEMTAIEISHMAYHAELSDEDLTHRLALIQFAEDKLKNAKKAYQEDAMHRLRSGRVVDDYAIEDEYTNRNWHDGMTPDVLRVITGKSLIKETLITPKQAELAGVPKEVVALLAGRKYKGSKLVRVDANKRATKFFGSKK